MGFARGDHRWGALAVLGVLVLQTQAADAAVFKVNRTDDPPPGACTPSHCTLREAINAADANGPGPGLDSDFVRLVPHRTYRITSTLTISQGGVTVAPSHINLAAGTSIGGKHGLATIRYSSPNPGNVLTVGSTIYPMSLQRLHITGGHAEAAPSGGGINVFGGRVLVIEDSLISGNRTTDQGGGIRIVGGAPVVAIERSLVTGNRAAYGGGITLQGPGIGSDIVDSTVSGNTAQVNGGGVDVYDDGRLGITRSTITGNEAASGSGGGVMHGGGSADDVQIFGSIIDGNRAPAGPDCFGLYSGRLSVIGSTSGCGGLSGSGNVLNRNAGLEPLRDNGGLTKTYGLRRRSPARNMIRVRSRGCRYVDQRGIDRQLADERNLDRRLMRRCDAGAYQYDRCFGNLVREVGPVRSRVIRGTRRNDGIRSLFWNGKTTLVGKRGNDSLCGGRARDTLKGGPGNDKLHGGPKGERRRNANKLRGGGGNDSLFDCRTGPHRPVDSPADLNPQVLRYIHRFCNGGSGRDHLELDGGFVLVE